MHASRRLGNPLAIMIVCICLVPLLFMATRAWAARQIPSISLTPTSGAPGSTTTVSGVGFRGAAPVTITFDTTQVATIKPSHGSFTTTISIPSNASAGTHVVEASDRNPDSTARATFTVVIAATDWPQFRFSPDHTGFNPFETVLDPTNVNNLTLAWSVLAAPGNPGTGSGSSPAVVGGRVYIGADDSALHAFDASTGASTSTAPMGGFAGSSSPAVANGIIYTGSDDAALHAVDATTGAPVWTAQTGGNVRSSPAVSGGRVFVGSSDGKVYAFDAATGTTIWSSETGGIVLGSPAVANGTVYVGSYDGNLYALDATTGVTEWADTLLTNGNGILSSPAVVGGIVYVGTQYQDGGGHMYAVVATTGAILWSVQTAVDINSSPAVANGVVYVGGFDSKVYAFNAATGELQWSTTTIPGDQIISSPAVANGVVYIATEFNGEIYALDANTGVVLWTDSLGGGVSSSPTVVNGVLYIDTYNGQGDGNGHLFAFHLP